VGVVEIYFITIFPEAFSAVLEAGILGVAARKGAASYHIVDLRAFAEDRYGSVDDYPYGGGPGMILMAPPIVKAVESIASPGEGSETAVVLMSPCGRVFNQQAAIRLAQGKKIVFICGRYKGVDQRVDDLVVTETISVGDYVVSGGELPSLIVADAVVRNLSGILGDERSRETDSFSAQRAFSLDAAYYTRPEEFRGLRVPEVLLSGNHAKIDEWRRESALERTRRYRPDLIENMKRGDNEAIES
jgi:tRNA (guanine37-N1)-methyltransferase